MTKKHIVAGLIGLAVILGWNVFLIQRDENLYRAYYHSKELDSLRKVVKMYQQDVSELNTTVTELNSQIEDLKYTIRRRENTIATLKKETNERINTVSKFTSSDIYKFLSDRYAKADTAKAR